MTDFVDLDDVVVPDDHSSTYADRISPAGWGSPDLSLLGSNRRMAPTFPLPLLGPFWSHWATRAAEAASCPVDYTATALLGAIGASLGNVRRPILGAGWSEPPLLWAGLVGQPSSGKSPGLEAAFSLIRHAEDELAAGFDLTRRDHEGRKVAAKAARELWETEVKAATKAGEQPSPMPSAAEEPQAPVRPRIRVADATTEKLAVLSAGLPRGILLGRDELAGWAASFDRYGGYGADRGFFLEAFGGRSFHVDRMKNAEPIAIRHLSIGVLGSTQPDRLALITGGRRRLGFAHLVELAKRRAAVRTRPRALRRHGRQVRVPQAGPAADGRRRERPADPRPGPAHP